MTGAPKILLLGEDSPGDVRLTQEAFAEADNRIEIHVAVDGVEAMEFLQRQGVHSTAPRPDLILLDLNLPRMDGREVLSRIKNDDSLKLIPTVILTTSSAEDDVVWSYGLHANVYLTKPVRYEDFEDIVCSIRDFWLTIAQLPKHGSVR